MQKAEDHVQGLLHFMRHGRGCGASERTQPEMEWTTREWRMCLLNDRHWMADGIDLLIMEKDPKL